MKTKTIIGLTGGIATGKTSIVKELSRRRIPTISSDALAHACLRRGHPCYRRVVSHFGRSILKAGGEIHRKKLGAIVFANPRERKWLEKQIHPCVVADLKSYIRKHHGLIVLDIPLLYEAHLDSLVDKVVVVWSSRADQMRRILRRDRLTRAEAGQRIRAQMPLATKKKRADYRLPNTGSPAELRKQINRLVDWMRRNS